MSATRWMWKIWALAWVCVWAYVATRTVDGGDLTLNLIGLFLLTLILVSILHPLLKLILKGCSSGREGKFKRRVPNIAGTTLPLIFVIWCYFTSVSRTGLMFEVEAGGGASGSYGTIRTSRIVGENIRIGPECNGSDPLVWYADRDGDGNRDLTCFVDGIERSVFKLIEIPTCEQLPFQMLRGSEVWYPEGGMYAQYGSGDLRAPSVPCND